MKMKWCYICKFCHSIETDCFTKPEKIKLQKALQEEIEIDEKEKELLRKGVKNVSKNLSTRFKII